MHVGYMYVHACGVLRLMVEIFNCSSILVTEARSPSQTQSSPIWLVFLVSMFWGLWFYFLRLRNRQASTPAWPFTCGSENSSPYLTLKPSAILGGFKTRKGPHLIACAKALPW